MTTAVHVIWWISLAIALGATIFAAALLADVVRLCRQILELARRTVPAAQGIDRVPYPTIPRAAFEMERHGFRSAQAERLREEYAARVEAQQQRQAARESSAEFSARPQQSLEDIRRQAREEWRRMRQASADNSARGPEHTHDRIDDDQLSR